MGRRSLLGCLRFPLTNFRISIIFSPLVSHMKFPAHQCAVQGLSGRIKRYDNKFMPGRGWGGFYLPDIRGPFRTCRSHPRYPEWLWVDLVNVVSAREARDPGTTN